MDLNGQAALVTAGATGFGAALVRRLTAAGAVVAILDDDEPAARELAEEVGGLAHPGDVTDPDRMSFALDIAEDSFGRLTMLFLNASETAAQGGFGTEQFDVAAYRRLVGVNVDYVVFGLSSAVPALRRAGGGTVVVTASLAGLVPIPGQALDTLTKHAVVGYVRAAAPALADEGIKVCALCPAVGDHQPSDEELAAAAEAVLERGEAGECWVVQAGQNPSPYTFPRVPALTQQT